MENKEKEKESFISRFKKDKVYNAKVQLVGYVVFIVIVVIYVNVSHIDKNYDYNNVINNKSRVSNNDVVSLFSELNDNYLYDVTVNYKIKTDSVSEKYNGKRYKDNMTIKRTIGDKEEEFYKISDEYYSKVLDNYKYIDVDTVYENISFKYIELDSVMKLIKKANLEHAGNKSNSEFDYTYNLFVKDIVQSFTGEDVIVINVNSSTSEVTIEIDYSPLFKEINSDISECNIKYVYSNINKVEEFVIIENNE